MSMEGLIRIGGDKESKIVSAQAWCPVGSGTTKLHGLFDLVLVVHTTHDPSVVSRRNVD